MHSQWINLAIEGQFLDINSLGKEVKKLVEKVHECVHRVVCGLVMKRPRADAQSLNDDAPRRQLAGLRGRPGGPDWDYVRAT